MLPIKEVEKGQIYTDLAPRNKSLRRLLVEQVEADKALCSVAYGPNGRFEKSAKVVRVACRRLKMRSLYRINDK